MKLHAISGLEIPGHGFRADASQAHLPLWILGIHEVDIQGNLTVDADGLNFLDERFARSFEHYFRRPLTNTSIESGRGFTNARRTRPSSVCEIVAGIAVVVKYHPAGRTMSLRGRPKLRRHINCPSIRSYRAGSVYVSSIRSLTLCPFLTGGNRINTTSVSGRTGSPISSFACVIAAPFKISVFNASPVSSTLAD